MTWRLSLSPNAAAVNYLPEHTESHLFTQLVSLPAEMTWGAELPCGHRGGHVHQGTAPPPRGEQGLIAWQGWMGTQNKAQKISAAPFPGCARVPPERKLGFGGA